MFLYKFIKTFIRAYIAPYNVLLLSWLLMFREIFYE